mmetsp:Transcript_36891/g.103617  ORF Transcript_36891/g.103617 Transcript_36891/m.103617 type:complete len:454 (-) Transcript_36891:103-1464(-)
MAAWAADSRFAGAAFLCICVDPDALATAKEFRQLYFAKAAESLVNGYIDSRADFPNFNAQLGCQGFVIFNGQHQIVEGASPAWLQHRGAAFQHVEGWLSRLLGPAAAANPLGAPIGQLVRVRGLTSESGAALNGQQGEVAGSTEAGRYLVVVNGESKAISPENLEDATGAPVGKRLRVLGLTSEKGRKLNGQVGEVLGGTASGRLILKLDAVQVSLKGENLQDASGTHVTDEATGEGDLFGAVGSVGHEAMDSQHQDCIGALKELSSTLKVSSLQRVRQLLKEHFDEEETLMSDSGFGGGGGEFSALRSHAKDHARIILIADNALSTLVNVCSTSDSYGGTVPKMVAEELCKAFVDHATMYDSLYEGKVNQVTTDEEWIFSPDGSVNHIGMRKTPDVDGERTGGRKEKGDVFRVCATKLGQHGELCLRLADGSGWLFDRIVGLGVMCRKVGAA